ncbi:MAG: hypothetical protein H0U69_13150 [Trueperaceae bacterium]|nr:hypothetical protein [Trueperaceae bacterium]
MSDGTDGPRDAKKAAPALHRSARRSLGRARRALSRSAWYRSLGLGARHAKLRWNRRLDPAAWSDADPYELRDVDPERIVYKQWNQTYGNVSIVYDDAYFERIANINRVAGGDWDLQKNAFAENLTYRIIHEHFGQGVAWRETQAFGIFLALIRSGQPVWHRCRSEDDLLARCARLERLRDDLRGGYRAGPRHAFDEITVNVGRDGDLLYNSDGAHRLSIAKVLGLPLVKARVLVRHAAWQAIREELLRVGAAGALSPRAKEHLGHPDLVDLVKIVERTP